MTCGKQAAHGELEAGAIGSKALRAAALRALRLLVAAVDDGDALAYFVPGIVSGLSKALLAAGAALRRALVVGHVAIDIMQINSANILGETVMSKVRLQLAFVVFTCLCWLQQLDMPTPYGTISGTGSPRRVQSGRRESRGTSGRQRGCCGGHRRADGHPAAHPLRPARTHNSGGTGHIGSIECGCIADLITHLRGKQLCSVLFVHGR